MIIILCGVLTLSVGSDGAGTEQITLQRKLKLLFCAFSHPSFILMLQVQLLLMLLSLFKPGNITVACSCLSSFGKGKVGTVPHTGFPVCLRI
jgi:hypothetical protein